MPGQFFVLCGDIRQLACDAWFLRCDARAQAPRFLPDNRDRRTTCSTRTSPAFSARAKVALRPLVEFARTGTSSNHVLAKVKTFLAEFGITS